MPLMAPSSPEPPAVAIAAAYYRSHREVRFFDDQKLRFVSVAFNALGIAEFGKIYRPTITAHHSLSLLCTYFGIASLNVTEIDNSQNIYSTKEFS